MWVNVGYFKNGQPVYLFLRSTPNKNSDANKKYALPHGTEVMVYATNFDGSWAWVYYRGSCHDPSGNPTVMDGFAWCAWKLGREEFLKPYPTT